MYKTHHKGRPHVEGYDSSNFGIMAHALLRGLHGVHNGEQSDDRLLGRRGCWVSNAGGQEERLYNLPLMFTLNLC